MGNRSPEAQLPGDLGQEFLETLAAAGVAWWRVDFESGRMICSGNFGRLHGIECTDASFPDALLRAVHPRDRAFVAESLEKSRAEGTDLAVEFQVDSTAETRWVRARGHVHTDQDGRPRSMAGFSSDITEVRAAQDASSRLAAIVDSSEDAIVSKMLDGTVVSWNRAAETIFGYGADEMVGRSIQVMIPEQAGEDFHLILDKVRRGERVEHYETFRRRKDGRIVEVSLTVSPVRDAAGRIIGASKIARDITAEKEAAREADRTRELFLGSLGHDLRNPLNTILASCYSLRRHVRKEGGPALGRIGRTANRMARMIDQLLDFTRSRRGGGLILERRPTSLRTVVASVLNEFEATHPGRFVLTAQGDPFGLWDPDRLGQLVSNLVGNAVLYGSTDFPVTAAVLHEGNDAVLRVHNVGEPIPPALQSVLFDPFRRGRTEQPTAQRGLGLGLYIAQQVARSHGGTITLRSTIEEGTTFEVRLPV